MSNLFSVITCFVAGLAILVGCAYHAGSGDRQIPGGYRSIAVPVFKNQTNEPGIEAYFTNAMIVEIERARVGTVTEKANSQVTLEGTIQNVKYVGGGPVAGDNILLPINTVLNTTYTVIVTVKLQLKRNSDLKVLWEGNFSKNSTYQTPKVGIVGLTSVNATYNQSARYQNIQLIAADMMSEAHDRLTENF